MEENIVPTVDSTVHAELLPANNTQPKKCHIEFLNIQIINLVSTIEFELVEQRSFPGER